MYIYKARLIHVTRITVMHYYIFTRIAYTLLTCDMYKSSLRHIHDPVLLSLKMEGILFSTFFLLKAAAAV
jgi:hypothetical protein